MKFKFLSVLGGILILSSAALANEVTCQSVLTVGQGTFAQLEAAGSCDIGNVTFSDFNISGFNPADLLVATDGIASSGFGTILGLTYSYLNNTWPGGSVGYTATFDPNAATETAGGVACPVNDTCGINGLEAQLNSLLGNGAVVTTTHAGGYTGTAEVDAVSFADETAQISIPIVVAPINIVKESTYNGMGNIDTFSTEVIAGDVSSTPEPATTVLLGGSLLAIGLLRRRKSSLR
jgi:hypothetical protein